MKQYQICEFIHINKITQKWNETWKDIILWNLANQSADLKKYNDNWYNIYRTFNTFFDWKRKISNINELRYVLIDLDYKNTEKEDYISLRKRCKELEFKYWIFPTEINETYKWYHLLYALDNSLYYIQNKYYIELANTLVEFFNWDLNAKQITGLYKMVWFLDHKDNRNFLITNKYTTTKSQKEKTSIKIELLKKFWIIPENYWYQDILKKSIYWIKTKWNTKWEIDYNKFKLAQNEKLLKLSKIIDKKSDKTDVYEMIENIDAIKFIESINNYDKWIFKNINIIVNDKSIDSTHWLKLFYKNKKWQIKDFAWKNRFWNRLFLINHVLGLSEEKNEKIKKEKLLGYVWFLRDKFWITFNKSPINFYLSSKIVFDYINNNIEISNDLLLEVAKQNNIKDIKLEDKNKYIDSIIYLYLLLEKYRQLDFNNNFKITFSYTEFLNLLWVKNTYINRKKIKLILDLATRIKLKFNYVNNQWKTINTKKNLFKIEINARRTHFTYTPIIWNINVWEVHIANNYIQVNEQILYSKWLFWKTYLKFMLYCIYNIKKFGPTKFSINQIKNLIWNWKFDYGKTNYMEKKINEYLKYLEKTKLIGWHKKKKTTYTIYKTLYKKKKEEKKEVFWKINNK